MSIASPGVLTVCHANVCRSPLAAYRLAKALPAALRLESLTVRSAGTDAVEGAALCATVAKHLTTRHHVADEVDIVTSGTPIGIPSGVGADATIFAAMHSAGRLDTDAIATAQLILTTGVAERSAVGKLVPAARAKTFTIIEAVELGRLEARAAELEALDAAVDDASRVSALAGVLHGRRGLLGEPRKRASVGFFARRGSDGLDVLDAHTDRGVRHPEVMRAIDRATADLVRELGALVALSTAHR